MADKRKILITVLIAVIVILAAIIVYAFVISPSVTGYTVDRQREGIEFAISSIIAQIQQNGFAQISVGNETLYLRPFNPQQQQPQQ
jgi:hypothetical protein